MSSSAERILPLAQQARGRCHACASQRTFDLPTRTVYFCRAYATEMNQEQRDSVRDCARWSPFRPVSRSGRTYRAKRNPLIADVVEGEDKVFAAVKQHLDRRSIDLKTVILLSQPGTVDPDELTWVDSLDARFDDDKVLVPLSDLIVELRSLGYDNLGDQLQLIQDKLGTQQ
jgi:hypothetical protein